MGMILNRARNLAADGILSKREVGQLISDALKDGKVTRGQRSDITKVLKEFKDEITPSAKDALEDFLVFSGQFDGGLAAQFFVEQPDADALEKAGVSTAKDLLLRAGTSSDRAALATEARIDVIVVESLASQADLARVVGIGKTYAGVLEKMGIGNVQELAKQSPASLRRQITSFLKTTEGRALASRRPSEASVKKWIENAKTMPKLIRDVGDNSPSFTVDAFNALNDNQKGMLIFGADVRVSDVALFKSDDLKVERVRRRPGHIADICDELERTGFDGDFEYTEMSTISRVKLGDEVIGYRVGFDVSTGDSGAVDSELGASFDHEMGGGDAGMTGWVDLALDKNGKVLSKESDMWPSDYEG